MRCVALLVLTACAAEADVRTAFDLGKSAGELKCAVPVLDAALAEAEQKAAVGAAYDAAYEQGRADERKKRTMNTKEDGR